MRRFLTAASSPRLCLPNRRHLGLFLVFSDVKLAYKLRSRRIVMPSNRPRVLIADDHTLVADLCRKLLETEFEVVGIVNNGRAMVRAASQFKPDVIIVDIAMPILNGLDASQQVKEFLPAVKLVFLTMNCEIDLAAEAFRRGASGYLLKTCAASEMVTAVREVLRGKSYMSQTLCKDDVNYLRRTATKLEDEEERLT